MMLALIFSSVASAAPMSYDSLLLSCNQQVRKSVAEDVTAAERSGKPVDRAKLSSPTFTYMQEVQTEACTMKALKDQLQKDPAALCKTKEPLLDCAYRQTRLRQTVTTGLTLEQTLLIFAGMKELETAPDKDTVRLQLADKILQVVEHAQPNRFLLSQIPQSNSVELLQKQDEQLFSQILNKTQENAESTLAHVHIGPEKTALNKWKTDSVGMLRSRIARLKSKSWSYK